jgi:predicted membrane channel-forming protein YqfA (hemolysin III family)
MARGGLRMKSGLINRIRISGYILIGGVVVAALSLIWTHPISFMLFILLGGILTAAGVILYLYNVVSH